jgi:hypothetical protein
VTPDRSRTCGRSPELSSAHTAATDGSLSRPIDDAERGDRRSADGARDRDGRPGCRRPLRPAEQECALLDTLLLLLAFVTEYLAFLAKLERDHPNALAIDVVPAVGLPVAIELGRRRTRSKHPRLRVWDQTDDGDYVLATEVG